MTESPLWKSSKDSGLALKHFAKAIVLKPAFFKTSELEFLEFGTVPVKTP